MACDMLRYPINEYCYNYNYHNYRINNTYIPNLKNFICSLSERSIKKLNLSKYMKLDRFIQKQVSQWKIKKAIYDNRDIIRMNNTTIRVCVYNFDSDYHSVHISFKVNISDNYEIGLVYDSAHNMVRRPKFFNDNLKYKCVEYLAGFIKPLPQNKYFACDSISKKNIATLRDYRNYIDIPKYTPASAFDIPSDYEHLYVIDREAKILNVIVKYDIVKYAEINHNTTLICPEGCESELGDIDINEDEVSVLYETDNTEIEFNGNNNILVKSTNSTSPNYTLMGYKIAHLEGTTKKCILKLGIPEDALFTKNIHECSKMRMDKCTVLAIAEIIINGNTLSYDFSPNIASSMHESSFKYVLGEEVYERDFDNDMYNTCSKGIHFFLHQQDALKYGNYKQVVNQNDFDLMRDINEVYNEIIINEEESEDIIENLIEENEENEIIISEEEDEIEDITENPEFSSDEEYNFNDDMCILYESKLEKTYKFGPENIPLPEDIIETIEKDIRDYVMITAKYNYVKKLKLKIEAKIFPRSLEALDLACNNS